MQVEVGLLQTFTTEAAVASTGLLQDLVREEVDRLFEQPFPAGIQSIINEYVVCTTSGGVDLEFSQFLIDQDTVDYDSDCDSYKR
jgi:hypothetical protein